MSSTDDLLRAVIEPIVTADGLDLEELDVALSGSRRRVRVVVDADGGVDLEHCAALSRTISEALDDSDVPGDRRYTLEVSSPGVSRPLTLPRHWRRNVGRLVRVVRAGGDQFDGRVVSADEHEAVLDTDGERVTVPYTEVARATVQVEFNREGR
ncbi:MAG: ribosome maturation factor RimP [Actinomycetota bacterium]